MCISTQSSTEIAAIPSHSIDYIFTDPPYADKVQYGELNFVWEAWLGVETGWYEEDHCQRCAGKVRCRLGREDEACDGGMLSSPETGTVAESVLP